MKQRVALPDFNQMWAGHVAASPFPRMHDDGAERAFWRDFMARKSYAPEPSTRQVLRHLRPLLRAMGVETALEPGPGRQLARRRQIPQRRGLVDGSRNLIYIPTRPPL